MRNLCAFKIALQYFFLDSSSAVFHIVCFVWFIVYVGSQFCKLNWFYLLHFGKSFLFQTTDRMQSKVFRGFTRNIQNRLLCIRSIQWKKILCSEYCQCFASILRFFISVIIIINNQYIIYTYILYIHIIFFHVF